jgi:hypothetical protein
LAQLAYCEAFVLPGLPGNREGKIMWKFDDGNEHFVDFSEEFLPKETPLTNFIAMVSWGLAIAFILYVGLHS